MQLSVSKDVQVNYPKNKVMDSLIQTLNAGGNSYLNAKANRDFGTLSFNIVNGINPFKVEISLFENGGSTDIKAILAKSSGSGVSESVMLSVYGNFLSVVSKRLRGEPITQSDLKNASGGCMLLLLPILGAAIWLLFN